MAITKKLGMPITGGRKEMSPQRQITNPQNQARQAQSQIKAPPAPFKNSSSGAGMPTGRMNSQALGQPYTVASAPGKVKSASPGMPVMSLQEQMAAVGYKQPVNYAGRNGPNGVHATGTQGVTRATKAAKATYPGLFGSNKYRG